MQGPATQSPFSISNRAAWLAHINELIVIIQELVRGSFQRSAGVGTSIQIGAQHIFYAYQEKLYIFFTNWHSEALGTGIVEFPEVTQHQFLLCHYHLDGVLAADSKDSAVISGL